MNNTLKILKSNLEYAEANYSDLRITIISTIDELYMYDNGIVTDDSLLETLEELIKEIRTKKIK